MSFVRLESLSRHAWRRAVIDPWSLFDASIQKKKTKKENRIVVFIIFFPFGITLLFGEKEHTHHDSDGRGQGRSYGRGEHRDTTLRVCSRVAV